ncbi:MAG TPA: molybdenum ABC transporter ATP-binding protein [Opitutaceae bacterium]|nr:molybdenum ABC transporter ATP-binding protein [Opitutaceae bacterium]
MLHATLFTVAVALLSTALILPPGIALGWLLARRRWPGKTVVETLVALPLVIPPVATGLILLKLCGRHGPLGAAWRAVFGGDIVFTWKAVVVATAAMSLPLLVRAVRVAFEEVPERLENVARTLGAGRWRVFFAVTLPLARRGLAAGTVLAFARALGEFGATVMLAGMIPGETMTLALGIYHEVQLGHDDAALALVGVSALLAFGAVATSEWMLKGGERRRARGDRTERDAAQAIAAADSPGVTALAMSVSPPAGAAPRERLTAPASDALAGALAGYELVLEGVRWAEGPFSLEVTAKLAGGATGLFGPSGSGKSTLVELVAGLRRPEAGRIALGETVLVDVAAGVFLPAEERRIGFVPQDGALFPHLSVEGNLRFAERRAPAEGRTARRAQVCALLGIEGLLARPVAGLSGGERQRVALARALVSAPRLLLLDEPLAALDAARKETVLPYLRRVRDALGIPMLFVSHARDEVVALCGELVVIDGGRLLQHGAVAEVFRRPANDLVARIVGVETILPGRLLGGEGRLAVVEVGGVRVHGLADRLADGTEHVLASIRAEDVLLMREAVADGASARNRWRARVQSLVDEGALVRVELDCGFPLVARLTRQAAGELMLEPGAVVLALVKAPNVHLVAR